MKTKKMKYKLNHLAMVGSDGIPVFLIPSATPDRELNERRKKERAEILNAVNSYPIYEALLSFAQAYVNGVNLPVSAVKQVLAKAEDK